MKTKRILGRVGAGCVWVRCQTCLECVSYMDALGGFGVSREQSLNQPLGGEENFTLEDVLPTHETGYEKTENRELVRQVLNDLTEPQLTFLKKLASCIDHPSFLTEDCSICEIREGLLSITNRIGEIAGVNNCAFVLKEILHFLANCR
jgi:hypothetical protein